MRWEVSPRNLGGVNVVYDVQSLINLVLGVLALGLEVFALVDASRHQPRTYQIAEKRTKSFWLILLSVCVAIGIVALFNVLSLFGLLAVVGAGVFLADVRPELRRYAGRRGGGSGPYGSW